MAQLYRYGQQKPVYFKITLTGVGVTGLTLDNADMELSKDGGAFANMGTEVSEVGRGVYMWTPTSAAQTQAQSLVLDLKDNIGSAFDENCVILITGGDPSAFLDADQ